MEIKILNQINREANSIATLCLGENKFSLTEKEWVKLVETLKMMRPEVVNEVFYDESYESKISELEERIVDLKSDLDSYQERIFELEGILDDEGIEYD